MSVGTRAAWPAAVAALAWGSAALATAESEKAAEPPPPIEARAPGRAITFEVVVDRAPAEVFGWWSTAEGVRKFLAPGATVEPRVGGLYQVTFDPRNDPEGASHGTQGARVLRFVPEREIAFEWTFPPLGAPLHTKPYPTWVEVKLSPSEARPGATHVSFAHRGFPSGGKWDDAYRIFRDRSWPLVLNRLVVLGRDGQAAFHNGLLRAGDQPESFDRVVVESVNVPAPLADVWEAWTTSDGITTFFAREARVEARPGGMYELYFDPSQPEGSRGSEGCRVLSVDAPRLLAFDWNAPPKMPAVRARRTVVNVQLEQAPGGQTEVRLTALGFGHGAEWEAAHAYFDQAWGGVLRWLSQRFGGKPVAGP